MSLLETFFSNPKEQISQQTTVGSLSIIPPDTHTLTLYYALHVPIITHFSPVSFLPLKQPPVGNRGPGGLAQVPQPDQHGRHRHRRRRAARRGRCPAHAPPRQLQVVLPPVGPEGGYLGT